MLLGRYGQGAADLQVALVAIPGAGIHLAGRRVELRYVPAHERRTVVIVAELAHGLHHIFLPVLQTVAIPVEVVILKACLCVCVGRGAIHAHYDVVDIVGIDGAIPSKRRNCGTDVVIDAGVGQTLKRREHIHALSGVVLGGYLVIEEQETRVLVLPQVGQAVAVGIDRARIQAAAPYAGRIGGSLRIAVYDVVLHARNRRGVLAAVVVLAPAVDGVAAGPVLAFLAVVETIAVGILVARVGRHVFVDPALDRAARVVGMVGVDRRTGGMRTARVGSCELRRQLKAIVVSLIEANRRPNLSAVPVKLIVARGALGYRVLLVGVDSQIELPAVRHRVAIGICAVLALRIRGLRVAPGLGLEGRIRVCCPGEDHIAYRGLSCLDVLKVLRVIPQSHQIAVS